MTSTPRRWTYAETALLRRLWPDHTAKEISRDWLPDRTHQAIGNRADLLRLTKQRYLHAATSALAEQIALARTTGERAPPDRQAAPYKNPRDWEELT